MSPPLPRLAVLAVMTCALAAACGDDDTVRPGLTCGTTMCESGQACCLDCDGAGLCVEPGVVCQGTACQTPADGAAGLTCGERTCSAGQVCCLDCDGVGSCGFPGTVCTGQACRPPDASPETFRCANIRCQVGQTCCGSCESAYCGPPGSDCASPPEVCPDGGTCGLIDEPCCQGACQRELQCCDGIGFPESGVCQLGCSP